MPTSSPSKKVLSEVRKHVKPVFYIDSAKLFTVLKKSDEQIKKYWHNVDISNIQGFSSQRLFKLFGANEASFSASLTTHTRMLVDSFRATAYKNNRSLYSEGQTYIDALVEKFNYLDSYDGFVLPNTIYDQISKMGRNILTSDNAAGALFAELDKSYEVLDFKVLDCDRVYFEKKGRKKIPYIYEDSQKVFLDCANFFWQPLDADAEEIMGNNPLRPGLKTTFTKIEFLDNLRKVLKSQAWPKIKVVLDEKATIGMAPREVQQDSKKLIEFLNQYIGKVEDQLTGITADQNIIVYDTIKEISFLESSKQGWDLTPIARLLDSELISSFKSPPSTVGKGGSTRTGEGLASAELVIFRRQIKALRNVIESIFSRAFTLALRLRALQGYVKFKLTEFTLRPPEESAQFESIKQETIISAWKIGAIGDGEKDKKIRHMHGFDSTPPSDAKLREIPTETNRQTGRTPDAEGRKEKQREETRKKQKTGSDRRD